MGQVEQAFLTIIRWPENFGSTAKLEAVVAATGLDPHTAGQRIAKGVPAVIHRVHASLADEVMAPLKQRRVPAMMLSQRALDRVPEPLLAKRLSQAVGTKEPMYLSEIWRAEQFGFKASDLFMIVRAKLRRKTRGEVEVHETTQAHVGLAGGIYMTPSFETVRNDRTSTSELLDLYFVDGRRLRINGDKFNFDVLGKERGFTDTENMDRLACRLAEQAPMCLVDMNFDSFVCPPLLIKGWNRAGGKDDLRNDTPAFDFYSVWRYLFNRATSGGERS